jgi:hypothetical protein
MSNIIDYTRPFLYPYQTAILNCPARFTICEASTKVGKTASHIVWLFEQALVCKANQSVWWVAPTVAQAKIAFDRMKVQITDKEIYKANESLRTITLVTGAKIEFKTADKADNLYGDDVYAFVFDEFTRAREAAWFALRSTITSTGGKGKFIGNVKGKKNWGHKMAMRAKTEDDKDYKYFKITAYDAAAAGMRTKDGRPFIEEIEAAKRDLPDSVFKELYLAEASEDGSNPFGLDHIRRCIYDESDREPICHGADLAKKRDWTVLTSLDQFGSVTKGWKRFQKDWKQTTEEILSLPKGPIAIDSTGVGDPIGEDISSKRDDVELFVFTSRTKQQLIEGLAVAIQKRLISFPEGIISHELEQFEFVYTREGVRYSAPSGEHDDCVMSLALAWHKYKEASLYINGPSVF